MNILDYSAIPSSAVLLQCDSSCIEEIESQWTEMQQKAGKQYSDLWIWTFAHRGMTTQQLKQVSGLAGEVIRDLRSRAQAAARPGSSERASNHARAAWLEPQGAPNGHYAGYLLY